MREVVVLEAVEPRYQGLRPIAVVIQAIFSNWMVVQVAMSTRPPVSPLLAFQHQYDTPCMAQHAPRLWL